MVTAFLALCFAQSSTDLGLRIDAFLKPYVQEGLFSGVVLAAKGDHVLFQKAYGLANEEWRIANTLDTRFCIASITKSMTISVVMQQLEAKSLAADDKLSKFVPGFANGDRITIAHLLNHRAGIPHRVMSDAEESLPQTAESMASRAARTKPLCEPGEKSIYSSAGFSVLARIIELVEKKPFYNVLEDRIFGPAGMSCTTDTRPMQSITSRATSYITGPSGRWPAPPKDLSFLVGAGSVWSTPTDLFKFLRAILAGKLGRFAKSNYADRPQVFLNGLTNGFRAFIDYDKATENTLIFCGNSITGAADALRAAGPKLFAGESLRGEVPKLPSYEPGPSDLSDVAGRYRFEVNGQELEARAEQGLLVVGEAVLVPTGKDRFFAYRDFGDITLERDEAGKVRRLLWKPLGGEASVMTRL